MSAEQVTDDLAGLVKKIKTEFDLGGYFGDPTHIELAESLLDGMAAELRALRAAFKVTDTPAPHVSHSAAQATGAEVAQQAASAPQAGMCSCGHDADEHHDEPGGDPCFGTDWDVSECADFSCDCKAFEAVPTDPTPPIRHERYMQLTTHSAGGLCTILRTRGYLGPLDTWSRHDLVAAILRAEGYGLEQNSPPAVQA